MLPCLQALGIAVRETKDRLRHTYLAQRLIDASLGLLHDIPAAPSPESTLSGAHTDSQVDTMVHSSLEPVVASVEEADPAGTQAAMQTTEGHQLADEGITERQNQQFWSSLGVASVFAGNPAEGGASVGTHGERSTPAVEGEDSLWHEWGLEDALLRV